jgi:hypothetical protein
VDIVSLSIDDYRRTNERTNKSKEGKMASADEDYEYDYSDDEDYVLEDDDDAMEWNPMAVGADNPNAPPTIAGT